MKTNLRTRSVVFVKHLDATFVNKDRDLLAKRFEVNEVYYSQTKGVKFAFQIAKSLGRLILRIRRSSAVFIWFADYHAVIPTILGKIFKKPVYIFIGGYDAAKIPELNYGAYVSPVRAACTRFSVRNASCLLPVDLSLYDKLKSIVPNLATPVEVIPFGFNSHRWKCTSNKEKIVLTVSIFETDRRIKIKGLDFFASVAKCLPEYKFYIIGSTEAGRSKLDVPDNLILLPKMPWEMLREWYSKAAVYAQFSLSEGMPNALCEAMLCECIPVVTNVGAMASVVGDSGFLLKDRTINNAKAAILSAFEDHELGRLARDRIIEKYPISIREEAFMDVINKNLI